MPFEMEACLLVIPKTETLLQKEHSQLPPMTKQMWGCIPGESRTPTRTNAIGAQFRLRFSSHHVLPHCLWHRHWLSLLHRNLWDCLLLCAVFQTGEAPGFLVQELHFKGCSTSHFENRECLKSTLTNKNHTL